MDKNTNLSYQIIDSALIGELSSKAAVNPRCRMNHNLHQLTDKVQRFLNAVEPDSYIRPHRHMDPPKSECFIVLQGKFLVILFEPSGNIKGAVELDTVNCRGIDVAPQEWHTVISLESGGVFFEVKEGPYVPASDKDFAPWSPPDNSPEAAHYLKDIREKAFSFLNDDGDVTPMY